MFLFAAQDYASRVCAVVVPIEAVPKKDLELLKFRGNEPVVKFCGHGLTFRTEALPPGVSETISSWFGVVCNGETWLPPGGHVLPILQLPEHVESWWEFVDRLDQVVDRVFIRYQRCDSLFDIDRTSSQYLQPKWIQV